jgi:hypothetical protein
MINGGVRVHIQDRGSQLGSFCSPSPDDTWSSCEKSPGCCKASPGAHDSPHSTAASVSSARRVGTLLQAEGIQVPAASHNLPSLALGLPGEFEFERPHFYLSEFGHLSEFWSLSEQGVYKHLRVHTAQRLLLCRYSSSSFRELRV